MAVDLIRWALGSLRSLGPVLGLLVRMAFRIVEVAG